MQRIIWILINCNSTKEADKIGSELLQQRLISCFDIFERLKTSYFWPPKSRQIESATGALFVGETLPEKFDVVSALVKQLHSDELPFIGSVEVNVEDKYFEWVRDEVST